ncbi:MAG: DUF5011 domain-containing protein, partial [bacterium]|nr:DUF5011 domain-containing protein [bacterium]
ALAGVPVKVTVFGGFPTPAVYTNSLGQALFPGIASYATYNVAITDGDYVPYTNSVYVPCSPYTAHAVQLTPLVTPPVLQVTSSRSVGAPTGAATFDVANTGADVLNWSAAVQGGATGWLTIDSGAAGVDAGTIGVSCAANTASTSRNGYLLVTATDSGGGTAVNSPVEVQVHQSGDTEAPIITVLGDNLIEVEIDTAYVDAGAEAVDAVCGDLTGAIGVTSTVDTSTEGAYSVTYTVTDTAGNVETATRTVNVVFVPPVLQVTASQSTPAEGGNATFAIANSGSDELNWTAVVQGAATSWLSITSSPSGVDAGSFTVASASNASASPRTGVIRVTATDSNGDPAVGSPVDVTVEQAADTEAPVLTLQGETPVTRDRGSSYTDAGCAATDNVDGDISAKVQVSGSVDASTVGIYTLTYSVSDTAGNAATPVTRTVNVVLATTVTETVDGDGGTVTLDGIIVTILPEALTGPTEIGIDRVGHGDPELPDNVLGLLDGTSFDVGPDGLTADGGGTLATVTIFYADADQDGFVDGTSYAETDLVVVHIDESTGDVLDLVGVVDTEANTITVETESFSIFVIGAGDGTNGLPMAWWAVYVCVALILCMAFGIGRARRYGQ